MICSVAVLTGFASLISVQYHFGWGRHQSCTSSPSPLSPQGLDDSFADTWLTRRYPGIEDLTELEIQIKFNITGQSFGIMGSTFARTSFIVFMIALFGSKKWVRWTLWAMFVLQFVTNLGTVIIIYVQCKDPRALYIFTLPEELCWPSYVQTVSVLVFLCSRPWQKALAFSSLPPFPPAESVKPPLTFSQQYLGWAHTAFNGLCDAFLAILPTIMIWNLNMRTRLKVGLAVLLSMSAM